MADIKSSSPPLVIIPAYNPGILLSELLERLIKIHPPEHIVVVNDGSTDNTEDNALKLNVNLIKHNQNRGKGAALVSGFQFALKNNYEAVITIDADLQHLPEYIPKLIVHARNGGLDMVIGSRRRKLREIPLLRRLSNYTTSVITSMITKTFIEDSQSGFRFISMKVIKDVKLTEPGYQLETEIIIKAVRSGFKIGFYPIPVIYNNSSSSMDLIRDTLRFIRLTFRSFFY